MTVARPERKARHFKAMAAACVGLLALACDIGRAATTELVVVNRHTGLAIDGFDPVAYFVNGALRAGRAELELRSSGAVWRFANEGNRAAFAGAPAVYRPRFGGYDPVALGRGVATAGHPSLWLIVRQRLYLFYNDEARAAFAADPEGAIASAERQWPDVQRTLTP